MNHNKCLNGGISKVVRGPTDGANVAVTDKLHRC